MGKTRILKRRRIYSKNTSRKGTKNPKIVRLRQDAEILPMDLSKSLTDEKEMALAFWQFLRDNEPAEAMDVIATYLEEVNKLKLSKDKAVPRATIYRALRRKNVTIKTIAKVLHSLAL